MASSSLTPPSDDDEDELGAFIYNVSRTAKRRAALEERDRVPGGVVLSSPTAFTTVGIDACHKSDSNNSINNDINANNNGNNVDSDPALISPLSSPDPITSAMDSDLGRQQLPPGEESRRSPSSSPPQGTKQGISTPEATQEDGGPRGAECARKECADLADEVLVRWRHHIANLNRRHPSPPTGADDGRKDATQRTYVPLPSESAVFGGNTTEADEGVTDAPGRLSFRHSPSPNGVVVGGEGTGGANDGGIGALKRRCVPSLGGNLVAGSSATGTDEDEAALSDQIGFGGPSSSGKRMFPDKALSTELGDGKPLEKGVVEPAMLDFWHSSSQVSQGCSGDDDDGGGDGCAAAQRQTNVAGGPNQDGNVDGGSTTKTSGNGWTSSNNSKGHSDGSTFIQPTMMTEQNSLGKITGTPDGMLRSEEHVEMFRYFKEWSLTRQLVDHMPKALETLKGPDLGNAGYDGVSTNSNHAVMGGQTMGTVPKHPGPDLDNADHCGGSSNSNSAAMGSQAMKQSIRDAADRGGSSGSNHAAMGNQTTGSVPSYPETLKRPALDNSYDLGNYNSHIAMESQAMAKRPGLGSTSHGDDGFDSTHSGMGSHMNDGILHCPGKSTRPNINNGDYEGGTTDSSHATMDSDMMTDSMPNATEASKQPTLGNSDRGGPNSDMYRAAMGIMMMADKGTAPVTSERPALGNDSLNSPYSKIIRASKSLGLQKHPIHEVAPTPGTSERLAPDDVHRYSPSSEIVRDAKSLGNRKCSIDEISLTIERPALGDAHRCSPIPKIIHDPKSRDKRKFDEIRTRCDGDEGGMGAKKALLQQERIVHLEESEARLDRVVKDSPMACRHVGCANQIVRCGVCLKHGAISHPKMCTHFGCTDRVEDSDVCIRHSAHVEAYTLEGCSNQTKKKGVCKLHRTERKTCSHEGCANFCINGKVCIKHGAKVSKACGLVGCTDGAIKGDVCWKCVYAAWAK